MKTLIKSAVLFLIVVAFVIVNSVLLSNLFSDIDSRLDKMPDSEKKLSEMSVSERKEYSENLDRIKERWLSWEQYIYITLSHDVSAEFTDNLLPTIEYFDSEDYSSYLASLAEAKDVLKQIRHNEGISFGTLF